MLEIDTHYDSVNHLNIQTLDPNNFYIHSANKSQFGALKPLVILIANENR